MHTNRGTN